MIIEELFSRISRNLGLIPTSEQSAAMQLFSHFVLGMPVAETDRFPTSTEAAAYPLRRAALPSVMILRGSAGTGKTTLASAFVKTLSELGHKIILLAPTGRAAKVFALNSGHDAFTIHRKIYLQQSMDASGGQFSLNYNKHTDTLFMVDEASMIANDGFEHAFGSGRLLDDLIQFVFSGKRCRLLLIGDKAQLPPVGESHSPALSADVLRQYGLEVVESDLNEVVRQHQESGILWNATAIRQIIQHDQLTEMPKIKFQGFADIVMVPGGELIETLASSYSYVGLDETMVITRSNKRANIYNQGIRNQVLGREEYLDTGDMLMIVKNNYYWLKDTEKDAQTVQAGTQPTQTEEADDSNSHVPSFLANGDIAVVKSVRNSRELYGFNFVDVWLSLPDYDDYELQATLLIDTLSSEAPALSREQSEQLYNKVMEDYADIPNKRERLKQLKSDIHFNAVQVKFAYAVTCHKAQGGQWAHVYIDQGYMTDEMLSSDYVHWLYTAFTRATEKLFLVNWPTSQTL